MVDTQPLGLEDYGFVALVDGRKMIFSTETEYCEYIHNLQQD